MTSEPDGTRLCSWYDESDESTSQPPCNQPATHYSCCEPGATPNVCEKHRCRCKPAVVKKAKANDENRGLYNKYNVERADGSSGHGGKHEHCEYFVLDFEHDKYAFDAIQAYALACRHEYPLLAADLLRRSVGERHDALAQRARITHPNAPACEECGYAYMGHLNSCSKYQEKK